MPKTFFNSFQRHVYINVAAMSGLLEEKYNYMKLIERGFIISAFIN